MTNMMNKEAYEFPLTPPDLLLLPHRDPAYNWQLGTSYLTSLYIQELILSAKYKANQEKFIYSVSYWNDKKITK